MALKKVLQSRRAYQSRARRFSYSPSVHASCPGTSDAPGDLLAREPAVRTGALIGYARLSISAPLVAHSGDDPVHCSGGGEVAMLDFRKTALMSTPDR